jgi:YVTN family beta-propeller protein
VLTVALLAAFPGTHFPRGGLAGIPPTRGDSGPAYPGSAVVPRSGDLNGALSQPPASIVPALSPSAPSGAALLATVGTGDNPTTPCYDSSDGDVYVPDYGAVLRGGNNVSIISTSTNSLVASRSVGDDPIFAVYDPSDQDVYVLNFGISHNLTVLHGTSIIAWLGVGSAPIGAVYDPANGYLYVSNFLSDNVSVVNGTSVIASVNVGNHPSTPAYDAADGDVYVPDRGSNAVSIIKGTSVVGTVTVGSQPNAPVYDSGDGHVYVPNTGGNNVSVLAGTILVTNLTVGSAPYSATYDSGNGFVYVPNTGSDNVSVISNGVNVSTVTGGSAPRQSYYDSSTGAMYVTNLASNNVTMINGTTIVASIDVGTSPYAGVFDPSNSETYITDYNGNNVSVLGTNSGPYQVIFNETGLPSGTAWGARIGATTFFESGPSIAFSEPNATYNYSIRPIAGYTVNGTGKVTVSGQDVVVNVTFRKLFEIPFQETGLPLGMGWNVSIGSEWNNTTTPVIGLFEPNGTYTYDILPIPGYTTTWSGQVQVSGAHATVPVVFSRVNYTITFDETGLPGGTLWAVTLAGGTMSAARSAISFVEPNGTYRYTVNPVPGYSGNGTGNVTLRGSGQTVAVRFVETYAVRFLESGLPAGTSWSVRIGNSTNGSTTSALDLREPNGTYEYTVTPVAGFVVNGTSPLSVLGAGLTVPVAFRAVYVVTFLESGLSKGTPWAVLLGSANNASSTPTIGFLESNGSFAYTIEPVTGYLGNGTGQVAVSGAARTVSVTFVAEFRVTFLESGLPTGTPWSASIGTASNRSSSSVIDLYASDGTHAYRVGSLPGFRAQWTGIVSVNGAAVTVPVPFVVTVYAVSFAETGLVDSTSWSVTLNGSMRSSTGPSINFEEPNGTYPYSVAPESGYLGEAQGSLRVAGVPPATVQVAFQPMHGRTGFGAISGPEWGVLGAVAIAILVALAWVLRRRTPPSPPDLEGPPLESVAPLENGEYGPNGPA